MNKSHNIIAYGLEERKLLKGDYKLERYTCDLIEYSTSKSINWYDREY